MKNLLFILFLTFTYVGFGQGYMQTMSSEDLSSRNRQNLNKISLGMTKSEVLEIMGTDIISIRIPKYDSAGYGKGKVRVEINSPYKNEILKKGEKKYELLFYYSSSANWGQVKNSNLTPIVFFDNKVDGYGWMYVNDNIKKYKIEQTIENK